MSCELVKFLSGDGADGQGRMISEILKWSSTQLESCHDYIQWLFPNRTHSRFNPNAPILNDEAVREILANPRAVENVRRAFYRIVEFYHFNMKRFEDGTVQLDLSSEAERPWWITPGNHNFLRLTRILLALRELDLQVEFEALADILDLLSRRYHDIIGDHTINIWRDIASNGT
jgi:hypothetical protein